MTDGAKIEQPPAATSGVIPGKKFHVGTKRSQERLTELGFDPIEKLVDQYESLMKEDTYMETLKQASSVTQLDSNGNKKQTVRYSAHAHAKIKELLNKTANDLLRYGYGRVPESINLNLDRNPGMQVNLPGAEGCAFEEQDIVDADYVVEKDESAANITLTQPAKGKVKI